MSPEDRDNQQLLKDEYLLLQNIYEDFDRRRLTIKGWVGAGAIAGLALGLDNTKSLRGQLWPLVGALAACFWLIEWRWKVFQSAHEARIHHIEGVFRGEQNLQAAHVAPFQIFKSWDEAFSKTKLRNIGFIFLPSVMLPYVPIMGLCLWAWWTGLGV